MLQPGRVATLVQNKDESTWGVAYKVHASDVCRTFAYLNVREKGYSKHEVIFHPYKSAGLQPMTVLVYISTEDSPQYLGPASEDCIARQVISSKGCSGTNSEYVLNLASSMRQIAPQVHDEHLFTLETKIRELLLLSAHQKTGSTSNSSTGITDSVVSLPAF